MRRAGLVALLGAVAGVAVPAVPFTPDPVSPAWAAPVAAVQAAPGCAAADPFPPELDGIVGRVWAGHRITVAVLDLGTGCRYVFRPGERVTTASVLKVELYAGILLRAQREGRWLTPEEAAGAWPMITESANPPASSFFASLGGVAGVNRLSDGFGMTDTRAASPWGLTVTSAADQIRLLEQVVVGRGGPLAPAYRQALVDAMRSVVASQRWGIGAGVHPTWSLALKNGFADSRCCGWRTSSVGWVDPPGQGDGYVAAVLTDGWRSQADGVAVVEWLARLVAAHLGSGPYLGFPSVAAFLDRVVGDVTGSSPAAEATVLLAAIAGFDGAGAETLLDALLGSDASGRGDLVSLLYRGLLGRGVDAEAMAWWRSVVRRSGTPSLAGALLATPELEAATAGLDDGGFVAWAYERLLGRPPDGAGAMWWTAEAGRHGRARVLAALASSDEATARFGDDAAVVQVYDALLHRPASPGEVAAWTGTPRGRLAVAVVGSPEYRG